MVVALRTLAGGVGFITCRRCSTPPAARSWYARGAIGENNHPNRYPPRTPVFVVQVDGFAIVPSQKHLTADAVLCTIGVDHPILFRRMGSEPPLGWAVTHLRLLMPETIAYIDGLNLYYGALKNRPPLKVAESTCNAGEIISTGEHQPHPVFLGIDPENASRPRRASAPDDIFPGVADHTLSWKFIGDAWQSERRRVLYQAHRHQESQPLKCLKKSAPTSI